jgi:hypothetical protein
VLPVPLDFVIILASSISSPSPLPFLIPPLRIHLRLPPLPPLLLQCILLLCIHLQPLAASALQDLDGNLDKVRGGDLRMARQPVRERAAVAGLFSATPW